MGAIRLVASEFFLVCESHKLYLYLMFVYENMSFPRGYFNENHQWSLGFIYSSSGLKEN